MGLASLAFIMLFKILPFPALEKGRLACRNFVIRFLIAAYLWLLSLDATLDATSGQGEIMVKLQKILYLLLFLLLPAQLSAQDINMSAWLANDRIVVRCDHGRNQPAANAQITVLSTPDGKIIVNGRANANGLFVFDVPPGVRDGHGLAISVKTENGVSREWAMDAAELYAASSLTAGFDEANLLEAQQKRPNETRQEIISGDSSPNLPLPEKMPAVVKLPVQSGAAEQNSSFSMEQARELFEKILDERLEPIRQEIKAEHSGSWSWLEMGGAAGWLVGLVGLIFLFMARRDNN